MRQTYPGGEELANDAEPERHDEEDVGQAHLENMDNN